MGKGLSSRRRCNPGRLRRRRSATVAQHHRTPYIATAMNKKLKHSKAALREAERDLDTATTRTELNAAARRLMRAKAELKALTSEQPT